MVSETIIVAIISLLGSLGVNVVTEVLKKIFVKIPAQIMALVISIVLTVGTFFAWTAIEGIMIEWYMVAGAVVGSFFVAYAAMYGYDTLKDLIKKYTGGT